jgi:hypothetical protein
MASVGSKPHLTGMFSLIKNSVSQNIWLAHSVMRLLLGTLIIHYVAISGHSFELVN